MVKYCNRDQKGTRTLIPGDFYIFTGQGHSQGLVGLTVNGGLDRCSPEILSNLYYSVIYDSKEETPRELLLGPCASQLPLPQRWTTLVDHSRGSQGHSTCHRSDCSFCRATYLQWALAGLDDCKMVLSANHIPQPRVSFLKETWVTS